MKPKVPTVQASVWKELYSAAQTFNSLQPWNILGDLDLICVRDPSNGDMGFGAVMGSAGTLFGFALYRGAKGLSLYQKMVDRAGESLEDDDIFTMQDCLKVEFTSRSDLRPEDHAVMKQLNLSFRGRHAWPEFRSLLPGYAPWFLTEPEARLLTLGIRAACFHYDRINKAAIDGSVRGNECLIYVPVNESQTEFRAEWERILVYHENPPKSPILNLATINALKGKELKLDTPWEVDEFYFPIPVMDRERPYFLRSAAVCQQSSGFVFETMTAPPETMGHQMLADAICSAIDKMGLKPDTIFVRNSEIADALAPLARVMGFALRKRKRLAAIQALKERMIEYIMMRG